jgi:UDP-glucose 4-epimerase
VITIFITRLLRGDIPIIFGDGEQKRDFVHVDDVVEGTIKSLWGPPGVYNLGTGRALSILELANLLIAKIRPDVQPRFAPAQRCELRFSVADIRAASTHLGYFPEKSLLLEIESVIDSIRKSMSCLNEKPQ